MERANPRRDDAIGNHAGSGTGGPDGDGLAVAAYDFSNQTPANRATTLAFYEALGNYREGGQYVRRVRALRVADLSQVAAGYAVEPTWIGLAPKEKKP